MLNAAGKMRSLGEHEGDAGAPSSIFGSAGGLARAIQTDDSLRISMYPILSETMPEAAMGLASCLAYLLEQYQDTRLYRCFAKIDETDDSGEISREDYQFSVEDWELEGLQDNVQVCGRLEAADGILALQIELDTQLLQSASSAELRYSFADINGAINTLPAVAASILRELGGQSREQAIIDYAALEPADGGALPLLEHVFDWNLDIYLYMWDVPWEEADSRAQFLQAAAYCQQHPSEFAFWCLGMMAKQALQFGLEAVGEGIMPLLESAFSKDAIALPGIAGSALGLSQLGYHTGAIARLQPALSAAAPASLWRSMIAIYLDAGQAAEALDTCQRALEEGIDAPAILWQYVELLMAAEANQWQVEAVLLFEPDDYAEEEHLAVEIAQALKLYVKSQPQDLAAAQLTLSYLIDIGDEDIWQHFERLLQRDLQGGYTGDIIERLPDLESYRQAYEILERQVDANPYACVFLAQLALLDDDAASASRYIALCRSQYAEIDDELEIELQRLAISAELPGFEAQFAELKVMLSAQRQAPNEHLEALESAIEIAPKMIDLYVVLSRAYLSLNDRENAREVLTEGEANAGAHPQLLLGLTQILWASGQKTAAIAKLNEALSAFPNDVYLLAQMAHYLLENAQFDDARGYIARAEAIAPSHPAVQQLRRYITQRLAR